MIGTFWHGLNAIKSGASRPQNIAKWKAKKVGVLGAGMMGAGIAYATASKGIQVVLKDLTLENAEKVIEISKSFNIEAHIIGRVEEGEKSLTIKSEFGEFNY